MSDVDGNMCLYHFPPWVDEQLRHYIALFAITSPLQYITPDVAAETVNGCSWKTGVEDEELVSADGSPLCMRAIGIFQSAVRTWDDPNILNVRVYITMLRDIDRDSVQKLYGVAADRNGIWGTLPTTAFCQSWANPLVLDFRPEKIERQGRAVMSSEEPKVGDLVGVDVDVLRRPTTNGEMRIVFRLRYFYILARLT